jgi:hypothetical protein
MECKYVGGFKDGQKHGQGTYFYTSGMKYVGEYKDDVVWNGIEYSADGTVRGRVLQGVWESEAFICVEVTEYMQEGKSMIDCETVDGGRYIGEWKDGQRIGQGTQTYPNGDKYVGKWNDDLFNGQGTYTFDDGQKYTGEYKDGVIDGQGAYFFVDGSTYIGEFKDGLMHGQGTHTWSSGAKYVGEYKDGTRWVGIFYRADGTVRGAISNGELVLQ